MKLVFWICKAGVVISCGAMFGAVLAGEKDISILAAISAMIFSVPVLIDEWLNG